MSERTFRAVVAVVLIAGLLLAVVVSAILLGEQPTPPTPSPSPSPSSEPTPGPTAAPTIAGPAFDAPTVSGVGAIAPGAGSPATFRVALTESGIAAIGVGPGSFTVTLLDSAGTDDGTLAFTGTPVVDAPGSLGATARLTAPNVLTVEIADSDQVNIEPIAISGLGIRVTKDAPPGDLAVRLGGFAGSLSGGAGGGRDLPIGSVAASP